MSSPTGHHGVVRPWPAHRSVSILSDAAVSIANNTDDAEEVEMARWPFTDDRLRAMYASGHGDQTARRFARFWAAMHGIGVMPRRWVTLEVPGRRSGRVTRFPLGMADWQGQWFLVSMLGNDCNWVQNVRAANGQVVLHHRRRKPCHLVEVPVVERPPIIKRYLQTVPGGRPHVPVDRNAPTADFADIADQYPVFRVEARTDTGRSAHHARRQSRFSRTSM